MISLILLLIIVGFGFWLLESFAPIDARFKRIIEFLVVIVLFVYVLQFFGLATGLPSYHHVYR